MSFDQSISDHRQQLIENRVDFLLLLDEINDSWKMETGYITGTCSVRRAMRSKSGMRLQHGGALNATSAQKGENIVNEKPLFCSGIPIQMDRNLDGRSIFQHSYISSSGIRPTSA